MKRLIKPKNCGKSCKAICKGIAAMNITIEFHDEEYSLWDRTLFFEIAMDPSPVLHFTERDLNDPFGHIINTDKYHNGESVRCFLFRSDDSFVWITRKQLLEFDIVAPLSNEERTACKATKYCPRVRALWFIPHSSKKHK